LEQEKLEESTYGLKSIRTVFDSLRKTNLLFRLTAVEEENRNFKRVKNLYEEIVNIGNENEIANALRNLERVKKIEADGISRRRIVH
jgi:RNA polymerase-interacting CarD/CdnL/TRCF family regulator